MLRRFQAPILRRFQTKSISIPWRFLNWQYAFSLRRIEHARAQRLTRALPSVHEVFWRPVRGSSPLNEKKQRRFRWPLCAFRTCDLAATTSALIWVVPFSSHDLLPILNVGPELATFVYNFWALRASCSHPAALWHLLFCVSHIQLTVPRLISWPRNFVYIAPPCPNKL